MARKADPNSLYIVKKFSLFSTFTLQHTDLEKMVAAKRPKPVKKQEAPKKE